MAFEIYKPEWGAMRPIRGILFDMDGLVLDSEKLFCRFWREAAAHFGFSMSVEQSLGMRGLSGAAGTQMLHSYFGPEADYREIRAKRIALMEAFVSENGIELKPGIRELLAFAREHGIRTAITSSSPPERIRSYLGQHGLEKEFDRLCSVHEVKKGKPEPDIYLHGAAQLHLEPGECLALEDAPAGILSAYRAGCLPVIIPDLDVPGQETLDRCYARADGLADVIQFLASPDACTSQPDPQG